MPNRKGKVYMKANCEGCRALQKGKCVLGHKILWEDIGEDFRGDQPSVMGYIPMDICPKPRTVKKLRKIQRTLSNVPPTKENRL